MNGDRAAVRALLQKKADVNAAQVDGSTAMHWAVYRNDVETADLLLAAGANVRAATREGVTALAMVSQQGQVAMAEKLLKGGADARERGPNGETMVMYAARSGNADLIRLFVNAGADPNAREELRGTTALMWAAEQQNAEAVRALLALGADPGAKSGAAGLPQNYFAPRLNVKNVEDARERRRRAAAAGRTYAEQLELERREGAASVGPQPRLPADDNNDDVPIVAGLVGSGGGGLTALVFAAREGN